MDLCGPGAAEDTLYVFRSRPTHNVLDYVFDVDKYVRNNDVVIFTLFRVDHTSGPSRLDV